MCALSLSLWSEVLPQELRVGPRPAEPEGLVQCSQETTSLFFFYERCLDAEWFSVYSCMSYERGWLSSPRSSSYILFLVALRNIFSTRLSGNKKMKSFYSINGY